MIAGCHRLLIVTAVHAEVVAVVDGLRAAAGHPDSDDISDGGDGTATIKIGRRNRTATLLSGGVGMAAAAATTARALALGDARRMPYDAVLSVGIGGGMVHRVSVGGLAVGTSTVAADLGAASPDGFLDLDQLGFGASSLTCDPTLVARLRSALPGAAAGPILTVNTVTGTADGTAEVLARHPDAVAEAMEGFGVATAAGHAGVPFAELRAVSNPVEPRNRVAWRIPAALGALTAAFAALATVGT
ncbi:MAG TPA: futalosine hydrolase [Micromonosporaceae bacterium]|nr:futalosine hydrolase [Micromonosporaceae bacterium]